MQKLTPKIIADDVHKLFGIGQQYRQILEDKITLLVRQEVAKKKPKETMPADYSKAMAATYIEVHEKIFSVKPINFFGLNKIYKSILATQKELNPDFEMTPEAMAVTFRSILLLAHKQYYGKDLQLTTINKYISTLIAELRNGKPINNKPTTADLNKESSRLAAAMLAGAIQ